VGNLLKALFLSLIQCGSPTALPFGYVLLIAFLCEVSVVFDLSYDLLVKLLKGRRLRPVKTPPLVHWCQIWAWIAPFGSLVHFRHSSLQPQVWLALFLDCCFNKDSIQFVMSSWWYCRGASWSRKKRGIRIPSQTMDIPSVQLQGSASWTSTFYLEMLVKPLIWSTQGFLFERFGMKSAGHTAFIQVLPGFDEKSVFLYWCSHQTVLWYLVRWCDSEIYLIVAISKSPFLPSAPEIP